MTIFGEYNEDFEVSFHLTPFAFVATFGQDLEDMCLMIKDAIECLLDNEDDVLIEVTIPEKYKFKVEITGKMIIGGKEYGN